MTGPVAYAIFAELIAIGALFVGVAIIEWLAQMTSSNIIPFPPARVRTPARHLGSGAACQPAAASYSPIGNPAFDPVFFNEALYERQLEAVRGEVNHAE